MMDQDQDRLRRISDEIDQLLRKHDCGGVILLVSKESAAWRFSIPDWVGLTPLSEGAFRIQVPAKSDNERAVNTMHFVGTLRDMGNEVGRLFAQIFSSVVDTLGPDSVQHRWFGGFTRDN